MTRISIAFVAAGALTVFAIPGCKTGGKVDLSKPEGAARCQAAAIRAKNTDQWVACFHPELRDEVRQELGSVNWAELESYAQWLEELETADFELRDVPDERAQWGDKVARIEREADDFVVIQRDGTWLVLDTGL